MAVVIVYARPEVSQMRHLWRVKNLDPEKTSCNVIGKGGAMIRFYYRTKRCVQSTLMMMVKVRIYAVA